MADIKRYMVEGLGETTHNLNQRSAERSDRTTQRMKHAELESLACRSLEA